MPASRLATILVAGLTLGCQQSATTPPPTTTGGVAVIDLDAVAAQLGRDQQMLASINQQQAALQQQLTEAARAYKQQIAERRQAAAAQQAPQGVTLAAFEQSAQARLDQAKQQAEQNLAAHQADLIRQFRDQIRPAVRRVARARGLSVVVTRNDSVLYDFTDAVDITDAVVAELQTPGE